MSTEHDEAGHARETLEGLARTTAEDLDRIIPKLARVIAQLLRDGSLNAHAFGMHIEPGSADGWGQQVENWLRGNDDIRHTTGVQS